MINVQVNNNLKEDVEVLLRQSEIGTILNTDTLRNLETTIMELFFDYQCHPEHVKFRLVQTGANDVHVCCGNFYTSLLFNGIIVPMLATMPEIDSVMLDGKYPIYRSVGAIQGMPHNI